MMESITKESNRPNSEVVIVLKRLKRSLTGGITTRWIEGLCPHCLEQIKVDTWEDSKSFTCPYCGRHFEIERLETEDTDQDEGERK